MFSSPLLFSLARSLSSSKTRTRAAAAAVAQYLAGRVPFFPLHFPFPLGALVCVFDDYCFFFYYYIYTPFSITEQTLSVQMSVHWERGSSDDDDDDDGDGQTMMND